MKEQLLGIGRHLFGAPPDFPELTLLSDEARCLFEKDDLDVYFGGS